MAAPFKQESRNPFFLWIVICTPLIYAISALGIYSLAAGLLYTRILFGISLPIANWVAFAAAVPAAIVRLFEFEGRRGASLELA